ncbi:MAG: 3'-5' exonuclease [Vulcanimicrobiaceae bacterium]
MRAPESGDRTLHVPLETPLVIAGPARSGKTTALFERARRADPATALISPDFAGLAREVHEVLGIAAPRAIDAIEAEALLYEAAEPLYQLEWDEFEEAQIDPEVGGVRMRRRFLSSAFRLICKLRAALVTPEEFLKTSLAGATAFYAKPPNLADAALIAYTKDGYRDSLDVDAEELVRQYRHEVDLAKIVARIYESYLAAIRERGVGTRHDVVADAIAAIERDPSGAERLRSRYRTAFIDDAQHLTAAELRLLRIIFGEDLRGVTLAGDPSSCLSAFATARGAAVFEGIAERVELSKPAGFPAARVETLRADTPAQEAKAIAAHVADSVAAGTPPGEIAVLFRSVRTVADVEAALLDRNVAVQIAGDYNIFADRRVLDAVAPLWNVYDPFRHDWLLRTLSGPTVGLSDASLATLCEPVEDAQDALFALADDAQNPARPSRWDSRRDLRLGWNVLRASRDAALSDEARARVETFRKRRESWVEAYRTKPFEAFVYLVWSQGVAAAGPHGSARARSQQLALRRLAQWFEAYRSAHPGAGLGASLEEVERRTESDYERVEPVADPNFVSILSIDAARGRSFAHAIVAGVQAGAFPRYYVPDAFLFSPTLGVIPKDNVGDARSSRTAKFTYYMYRSKTRESYNAHERRAFDYAMTRGRETVLVTASGRATRGIGTPELLEELTRALR